MDTKRRSYDIFDIEERVHALELGGGSTPSPGGSSWDYSTKEVSTGQKWTDGKDIYAKVYHFATPLSVNANSYADMTETIITDVDTIIDGFGIGSNGSYKAMFKGTVWYDGYCKMIGYAVSGTITDFAVRYTKTAATKKRSTKK